MRLSISSTAAPFFSHPKFGKNFKATCTHNSIQSTIHTLCPLSCRLWCADAGAIQIKKKDTSAWRNPVYAEKKHIFVPNRITANKQPTLDWYEENFSCGVTNCVCELWNLNLVFSASYIPIILISTGSRRTPQQAPSNKTKKGDESKDDSSDNKII